jgi:hypothetical protein
VVKPKAFGSMSRPQITGKIMGLLENRFGDPELWTAPYTEIQPGARYSGDDPTFYRVDFVVFKKRWGRCESVGVEIKSCRQDYASDKKWKQYPPHFSRFYFACPVGVIDPDELPEEIGLLTWSGTPNLRVAKAAAINPDRYGAENQCKGLLMACIFRGSK